MKSDKQLIVCSAVLIGLAIALTGVIAFGQPMSPATPEPATTPVLDPNADFGGFLAFLTSAFQGGQWFVVGGMVIMLLVWGVGRWVIKDKTKWLPVITAALGMLAGVVTGFLDPKEPWYVDLYQGLLASGPATMFWSLFGKRILPTKPKDEPS